MHHERWKGYRRSFASALGLVLLASCTGVEEPPRPAAPEPKTSRSSVPWLRDVQVVSVWPLGRARTRSFEVDIPGVFTWWDEDRVAELHRRGLVAVISVEGLAAEGWLLKRHPELRAAVSRDVFGNDSLAEWYQELQRVRNPVLVLTIQSPLFQEYLLAQGKRAVDIGADAFYIDEIQTSVLLIGRERYASGFSELELSAYDRHLVALGFDSPAAWLAAHASADWLTGELASRLTSAEMAGLSVADILRSTDPALVMPQVALFDDYTRFQQDEAIRIMSGIIQQVRDYASERGQTLAIGANLGGMGAYVGWSPMTSAAWATRLDFVVFENDVSPPGDPDSFVVSLPEGSFAPAYRLGKALTPGLVAAFPSVAFAPVLHELGEHATYISIMFAEAFAFEGNWAFGWWNEQMDWPRDDLSPASLADLTRFVTRWHRLYEGPRPANPVAVLYANQGVLANPSRHESFFGLCQGLGALDVQYDVVYAGDERFGDPPLAEDALGRYELVLAPTANELTRQQVAALSRYVDGGGEVIALAPVAPALEELSGVEVIDDVGLAYRAGDAGALDLLDGALGDLGRVRLSPEGDGVLATSYLREAIPGLVVHFVNHDYRMFADVVEPATAVGVEMERPAAFDDTWKLWVLAPDEEPLSVPYEVGPETISFTLPRLDVYAVAVFASELPEER
jgi:hypothetical protein